MSELTSATSRPLVHWLRRSNPYLLEEIDPGGPIGAIGTSISDAAALDVPLAAARETGLGVVVDTEPHRVQLADDHRLRCDAFKGAELNWLSGRFDPDTQRLSPESRSDLLARHRDAQAGGGATIFRWCGHRVTEGYELSPAREAEYELAGEFLALARASGATHPAPGSGEPRGVAIGLTLEPRDLRQHTIIAIAKAYAELDPDIFWIDVWNFAGAASHYQTVRNLARLLQRESGRPALLCGLGSLAEGALRNQVAAACVGWGRGELCFPPRPLPPPEPGKKRGASFGIHDFHPAIRGAVPLGEAFERAARLLYKAQPCDCENHTPTERPQGQHERLRHNAIWSERLGAGAIVGEPAATTAELARIVRGAHSLRDELGFGKLKPAWGKATVDPSDGERIEIPASLWLPRAA